MKITLKTVVCISFLTTLATSLGICQGAKKNSSSVPVLAQSLDLKNNARRVVSIYEDRFNGKDVKPIYTSYNPFIEAVSYIDTRSDILIYIDRDSLALFPDFLGSVSLTATINNRAIEVSPYSEVGKELKTVGVKGVNSTRDFASSLTSFISETTRFNLDLFCRFRLEYFELTDSIGRSFRVAQQKEEIFQFNNFIQEASKQPAPVLNAKAHLSYFDKYYVLDMFFESGYTLNRLITEAKIEKDIRSRRMNQVIRGEAEGRFFQDLLNVKTQLKLLSGYINYLSNSNRETSRAFSKSIDKDPIFVNHISEIFLRATRDYNTVVEKLIFEKNLNLFSLADPQLRSAMEDINYVINQMKGVRDRTMLEQLQQIADSISANSKTSKIFGQNIMQLKDKFVDDSQRANLNNLSCDVTQSQYALDFFTSVTEVRRAYNEFLAIRAARYIYDKLETATIDLRKEDAKEGDILRIYLTRYNSEGESVRIDTDTTSMDGNKKQVLIAAYDIKELGFRVKIADSFLLINRLDVDEADEDLSPSRYKGAPGASLLWSYGSDNGKNSFFKWWEPSLGINVSYLDFSREKDIEIGVAGVLGLFRNKIFIVAGRNLNVTSDSGYVGLGFSFTNLAARFTKSEND